MRMLEGDTMKRILAAIVLTLALVSQASADVPPANVVRVFVEDQDGEKSMGTGTLIRSDLIVTNWHIVKDRAKAGTIRVLFPDWSVYEAVVAKTDKLWDLAALRLVTPVLVPVMELGDKLEKGDVVTVGGYGSGWYRSDFGEVIKFYMPSKSAAADWVRIDARVRNGDSGGPIIRDGKMVGVLFGNSDGTYGTHVRRVRKFLKGIE